MVRASRPVRTFRVMGDHRKLEVWRRAQQLAATVNAESRRISRGNAELADQLRRAMLSVPTNVAEGASRNRDSEFIRFIVIALGSAAEADSLLEHARDIGALEADCCDEMQHELTVVRKMLFKLQKAILSTAAPAT